MKRYLLAIVLALATAAWSQELSSVKELHTAATGFAGTESSIFQTFEKQLARGEAARPVFQKCLKSGTAAARIYGALGLFSLDEAEGERALRKLTNESGKVKLLSGCLMEEADVSEIATELLSRKRNTLSLGSFGVKI